MITQHLAHIAKYSSTKFVPTIQVDKGIQSIENEQSVLDFNNEKYDFYLKHKYSRLNEKIDEDFEWKIKQNSPIPYDQFSQYLQRSVSSQITIQDIIGQKYAYSQNLALFSYVQQCDKLQFQILLHYLKQYKRDTTIYTLFTHFRFYDMQYLIELEEEIDTLKIPFMSVLQFYALAPAEPSWKICQILGRHLRFEWDRKPLDWKLRVLNYLFRIEGIYVRPSPFERYKIIDSILANKIEEFIIRVRFQNLNEQQRLSLYFLMNCYYHQDMMQKSFNLKYALYISSYLKNEFESQPRIQSNLQRKVESALLNLKLNFQKELLIENCFAVDFLIDSTVVEVNGPHHYFNEIEESKKTIHKTKILEHKGYRVINLAYFDWNKWDNQSESILDDLLRGLSMEDIKLIGNII